MKFLDEQRSGEPYLRREVPERPVVWSHCGLPDGFVALRAMESDQEADSEVHAATPRLESIRILIAWALIHGREIRTGDFSVALMFTPVPDVLIFVEAPAEAGLGADKVWRLSI
eukprot:1880067-Amphidinium_carterae.1